MSTHKDEKKLVDFIATTGFMAAAEPGRMLAAIGLKDMPETVLSGRLGEIYQQRLSAFPIAYAWPALVTSAGALVTGPKVLRTNLYCGLVGPAGTGKSQAIECGFAALGLDPETPPPILKLKAGSGEGLLKAIGDSDGDSRIYFLDELGHLLEKSGIEFSSFPHLLNSLYYSSRQKLRIARSEEVEFNCSLSVIGGVVGDRFDDLFGKTTTGGLYDRFIFGQCPSNYSYNWRPFMGSLSPMEPKNAVAVDPEVWEERDIWVKNIPGMTGRIAEHALRIASICAAFDEQRVLTVRDLGPAKAFAEHQVRLRELLRPNPGENFEARAAHKILDYLRRYAPDGQWIPNREMLRNTHVYDLGPSIVKRTIEVLKYNGDVEENETGRKALIRLIP